jgi:hypothetical protein
VAADPVEYLHRVRLFLLQMVMVAVLLPLLRLGPELAGAVAMLAGFSWLALAERRRGIRNPLTLTILAVTLTLFAVGLAGRGRSVELPAHGVVYAVLLCLLVACMAAGKPASACYGGRNMRVHWRLSILWAVLYAAAATVSFLWHGEAWERWFLAAAPVAGVAASLWLQFSYLPAAEGRRTQLQAGRIDVREIPATPDALRGFYERFIVQALPAIRRADRAGGRSLGQLMAAKMEEDAHLWPLTKFFLASDGAAIGTISCTLRSRDHRLGFEAGHTHPVSVAQLRRHGPIMEIGRFSIDPRYRFRQDVIQGLLRCAMECAFDHDVAVLVVQAYPDARALYAKMGFRYVRDEPVIQGGVGVEVHLMAMNLVKTALTQRPDQSVATRLGYTLSPTLGEWYFKRWAFRSLVLRSRVWKWTDAELRALVMDVDNSAAGPQQETVLCQG